MNDNFIVTKSFYFDRLHNKVLYFEDKFAGVVKLVYTLVLGTSAFGRGGSSPSTGTTFKVYGFKVKVCKAASH